MKLSAIDRDIIRALAAEVAGIAQSPENAVICRRWRDVNALRRPDRAPVWCRPVGAWDEILPDDKLQCRDDEARAVEHSLRQILIKRDIGDDTPVAPYWPVEVVFDVMPANTWGVDIAHTDAHAQGGAWRYDPPLKSAADFERLRRPRFRYNHAATQRQLEEADAVIGDILPVQLVCSSPLLATLGYYAADLRGLTEMMMDAAANPELLHRLMGHIRDAVLQGMDDIEATGLLRPDNYTAMYHSDPIGAETTPATFANCWCAANSQEFDQISPDMWREFCLEYQKPILARCGMTAYGCCENLTHKIDGVLSIPNLRIFVCSAWTDLDRLLEKVSDRYVIMWRQKASDVVFPDDPAILRRDLENGVRKLRGRPYQIVLRELQTLAGHPQRLHEWTRMAKELAEEYA